MRRLFSPTPMKRHPLLLAALCAAVLAGCDQKNAQVDDLARQNAELQARLAEQERAAKLRTAEEAAAAQAAANEATARQLAAEREALASEKQQLTAEQRMAAEAELSRREEALRAEKRRAAGERDMAAKEAAAREQDRMAEQAQARMAEEEQARAQAGARAQGQRARLDLFYDALDPEGDWFDVEGYGFVFQPRVANARGWRPYTDGGWVWTEQGWTWKSNEPFGWATYHYGRWARLSRRGWVWVPGSEWAPAWVAWRRSEQFVGWAPLPPEAHNPGGFNSAVDEYYDIGAGSYTFVPRREFGGEATYVGRVVAPERNVTIIEDTVNVTNLTYQVVNQQTVLVNEGPDFAALNDASAQPVPRLRLQRRDSREPAPARVQDGVIEMVAPVIAHLAAQSQPKAPKQKEAPEVDRGWGGMQPGSAQKLRARNATEARETEAKQRSAKPEVRAVPAPATPAPQATPMRRLPPATPMPVEKPAPVPAEPAKKATPPPLPPAPATPWPARKLPKPPIPATPEAAEKPAAPPDAPATPMKRRTPATPPAVEKPAATPDAAATPPPDAPNRRRIMVLPGAATPAAGEKAQPPADGTPAPRMPTINPNARKKGLEIVPPPTTPEGEKPLPRSKGRILPTPDPTKKPA